MNVKEEGKKYDAGKPRYDLIPGSPLEDLARVYTMGAAKYEDRGWEKGIRWSRIFAAIMRHLWAFWRGESLDPESGLPHAIHAAWGCFALTEFARTHPELDDRPATTFVEVFKPKESTNGGGDKTNPVGIREQWMDTRDLGLPGMLWVGPDRDLQQREWPQGLRRTSQTL